MDASSGRTSTHLLLSLAVSCILGYGVVAAPSGESAVHHWATLKDRRPLTGQWTVDFHVHVLLVGANRELEAFSLLTERPQGSELNRQPDVSSTTYSDSEQKNKTLNGLMHLWP